MPQLLVPTRPSADSSNAAASTAWVKNQNYITSATVPFYVGTASINADIAAIGSNAATVVYNLPTTLSANLTVPANVTLMFNEPGYVIQGGAYTLAINGAIVAQPQLIFSGFTSGQITASASANPVGYPEWFGAITGNTGIDCATYINLCIVTFPITQLQLATYYTTATILLNTNVRTLRGQDIGQPGTAGTSIIANQSATATILQVGPNTLTGGSLANTLNTCLVECLYIYRTVAPNIASNATSILVQYCTWATLRCLLVQDSIYGVHIIGTAQLRCYRVVTLRLTAGAGGGTDTFYGMFLDGNGTSVGGAGSSISTYIDECTSSIAVISASATTNYQGFVALGTNGFSDTFLDRYETAGMNIGLSITGNGSTGTVFDDLDEDFRIYNLISDSNYGAALVFSNISATGSIQVIGGYVGFNNASAGPGGILFSSSLGSIYVTGMQFLMATTSAVASYAVKATSSANITMIGNIVQEAAGSAGIYLITTTTNSRFQDIVTNKNVSNGNSVVNVSSNSKRNVFDMTINGKANAFSTGYYLSDATPTYNEFKCSGLEASAFSTAKLYNNGVAVVTATTFGSGATNLSSGIMN